MRKISLFAILIGMLISTLSIIQVSAENQGNVDKKSVFSEKLTGFIQDDMSKGKDVEYYIMIQLHDDVLGDVKKLKTHEGESLKQKLVSLSDNKLELKELYKNHNKNKSDSIFSVGGELLYISEYTPFVFGYMTTSQILKLEKSENIEQIYVILETELTSDDEMGDYVNYVTQDETTVTSSILSMTTEYGDYLSTTNLDWVKTNHPELEGNSITIGIMEANEYEYDNYGVVTAIRCGIDPNNTEFSGKSITGNSVCTDGYSNHATTVAIISSGTISGIANESDIVFAQATLSSTIPQAAENLANNGANVINSSLGYYITSGNVIVTQYYDTYSAFVDYFIRNTGIVWVTASGNKPIYENTDGDYSDLQIGPLGMAYNIITVGSTNLDGDQVALYSCFNVDSVDEDGNPIVLTSYKPNVVAPGGTYYLTRIIFSLYTLHIESLIVDNSPYNTNSEAIIGTSFASPQVAAAVALLMEYENDLLDNPSRVMSLLETSANATNIDDVTLDSESGHYSMVGAGLVNIREAIEILDQNNSNFSYTTSNSYYRIIQINVTAGDTLVLTNSYLKNEIYNSTMALNDISDYKDFDLVIVDSNYNIVAQTTSDFSNSEIIRVSVYTNDHWSIYISRRYHDNEDIDPTVNLIPITGALTISSQLGITIHQTYSGC